MSDHMIVCHNSPDLIRRFRSRALVVKAGSLDEIPAINDTVNASGSVLHCIEVKADSPLSTVPIQERWNKIPIALHVEEMGPFGEAREKLGLIRSLNLKLFFPSSAAGSLRSVRILSSLGIPCVIRFDENFSDWDGLDDLMHYAVYAKVNHAPVEPFHFIASGYSPNRLLDIRDLYFENPQKYLHVDARENIALSSLELERGIFIARGVGEISEIPRRREYRERISSWRDSFLGLNRCSCCEGWRICMGYFRKNGKSKPGCRELMKNLLEAAELYQKKMEGNRVLWQS